LTAEDRKDQQMRVLCFKGGGRGSHLLYEALYRAAVNMPVKLQRSPLAMSSAHRRETGEVSDGYQMMLDVEGVVDRGVC